MSDYKLRDLAIQEITADLENATVANFWDLEYGWKWDIFANFLPSHALQQIEAHNLKEDSTVADTLYWKGTP